MKKLLFILFLFLISCSTPESRIENFFKDSRQFINKSFKIEKIEIYDTLFRIQLQQLLANIEDTLKQFENKPRKLEIFRDSIFKLPITRHLKDSILKQNFKRSLEKDRKIERSFHQRGIYYGIRDVYRPDGIIAFYVRIITPKDTFNFIVEGDDYRIVCPVFMFK